MYHTQDPLKRHDNLHDSTTHTQHAGTVWSVKHIAEDYLDWKPVQSPIQL